MVLTFPACETRACEEVTIIDDDILEMTESFNATLTRTLNLDPRITLDPVHAVVIILDNDGRSPNNDSLMIMLMCTACNDHKKLTR